MESKQKYRIAPTGFKKEQWETFNEEGIIFIEDAISEDAIQTYIDAIDRVAASHPKYKPGGFLHMENIVERDPVFAGLIDNIFVAYCPSWLTPADRFHSSSEWLQTLNREQRIIMRSYSHAYHNAKPPASEFPLFLERTSGVDSDAEKYLDHVQLHRRKRLTMHERLDSL